jgi:spore coat polysaccharide biosynthesis protein SpsF
MGSSRLPGKVLADLGGRPALQLMLDRVRRAEELDVVVVATSTDPRDDAVADLTTRSGFPCFRGSEQDVLSRFLGAVAQIAGDRPSVVVRLTGDCPLIDPVVVDRAVHAFREGGADLVTTGPPEGRSYPNGMDVEVVSSATLRRLDAVARGEAREHVVAALHADGSAVRVLDLDPPAPKLRVTLDTPEDLDLLRALVARLPEDFTLEDVLRESAAG